MTTFKDPAPAGHGKLSLAEILEMLTASGDLSFVSML